MSVHRSPRPLPSPRGPLAKYVTDSGLRRLLARPRAVRVALSLGLFGSVAVITVGSAPQASAEAQQVLQSVNVTLSVDGAVSAVDSRAVRKSGSSTSTDAATMNPAAVASGLPVRISTTYTMNGVSGTDLDDIVGKAGHAVISVTVENTTVRPEALTYDTGSTQAHRFALVGTPLTVVASASLGSSDLSRIVTDQQSAGTATNGVLSQSADGDTDVQWAALLAPPRLAPSTTFTLVEDTAKFAVPKFDINVQPGLQTDVSLGSLINEAFEGDGSTQKLETRTIELVGDVNSVLSEAGVTLSKIQHNLDGSASTLGDKTITDLLAGRDQVGSHLDEVAGGLMSLKGEVTDQLHDNDSAVLGSLDTSLQGIIRTVGQPSDPAPALTATTGCSSGLPQVKDHTAKLSVLDQLRVVGAQLEALKHASPDCAKQVTAQLRAVIGAPGDTCPPLSGAVDPSAICTLLGAKQILVDQDAQVSAIGTSLDGQVQGLGLDQVDQILQGVTTSVGALQSDGSTLASNGATAADAVIAQLTAIKQSLTGLQSQLGGISLQHVLDTYQSLHQLAATQVSALSAPTAPTPTPAGDPSGGSAGAASAGLVQDSVDLKSFVHGVCGALGAVDTGSLPPSVQALLGGLSDCTSVVSQSDALASGLGQDLAAWQGVAAQTSDTSSISDAVKTLGSVQATIGQLQAQIDTALASTGSAHTLTATLHQVSGDLAAFYDPRAATPGCGDPTTGQPVLNNLATAIDNVRCNSTDLSSDIKTKVGQLDQVFKDGQGGLDASVLRTDQARSTADQSVDASLANLATALQTSRSALLRGGQKQLAQTRSGVTASGERAAQALGTKTTAVVGAIGKNASAATTDLTSANRQLTGDLTSVLADLGSRQSDSTGVLGTLTSSANDTAASSRRLGQASQSTDAFANVRSVELASTKLEQAQVNRSLGLQDSYPAFGIDVPTGSRVVTVFSYHLGG